MNGIESNPYLLRNPQFLLITPKLMRSLSITLLAHWQFSLVFSYLRSGIIVTPQPSHGIRENSASVFQVVTTIAPNRHVVIACKIQ